MRIHAPNRSRRGSATLEFAVTAPLLLLLLFGVGDFGRVFHHAMALSNAAATAAFFGAMDLQNSGEFEDIEEAGDESSVHIEHSGDVSTEAVRFCDCPDNPASGPDDPAAVSCTEATCDGYGLPRVFVQATSEQVFQSVSRFPAFSTVPIERVATIRSQ